MAFAARESLLRLRAIMGTPNVFKMIAYPAWVACALAFLCVQGFAADSLFPRPAFMPSTPPATKAIATYTATDMLGAVITSEVPADHPFGAVKRLADLKSIWPGAKEKASIVAMVQIVLDAPADAAYKDIADSLRDVRFVIQEIMDVSDADKASALVSVVQAQTDPIKNKRARDLAGAMFEELLDPRLLAFTK